MKYSPTPAKITEACSFGIVGIFGSRGSSSRTTSDRTRLGVTLARATYWRLTRLAVSSRWTLVRAGAVLTTILLGTDRDALRKTNTLEPPARSATGTRSCERAGTAHKSSAKIIIDAKNLLLIFVLDRPNHAEMA